MVKNSQRHIRAPCKNLSNPTDCKLNSVFFFFGSLFLFASQQKEKVNKGSITYIMYLCYDSCVMREIKNVLICGIGAVGSIYADKIHKFSPNNLRILVDEKRFERYSKAPVVFNGCELHLNYVLPENKDDFKADLIIIATKYDGLSDAVKNIKNYVKNDTVILSLLNGVTSERIIADVYGWDKLLLSYFIGHSAMRDGRYITQDGVGKIVFGAKDSDKSNEIRVKRFFDYVGIDYEIPEDMVHALWLKYMMNVSTNQPSAILRMTFGEMNANPKFIDFSKKLMKEVQMVAEAEGVKNTDTMIDSALLAISKMIPEGKTSMYQDVLAGRKTEVDMFAGTMIELGKKHNIPVPYSEFMYEMFGIIHKNFELQKTSIVK